jgi:hypothetical protein
MRASSAPARANFFAVGDHWGTGRTEAFSDGAFAITLLVLDIAVPQSKFHSCLRPTKPQTETADIYREGTKNHISSDRLKRARKKIGAKNAKADFNARRCASADGHVRIDPPPSSSQQSVRAAADERPLVARRRDPLLDHAGCCRADRP